MAIIDAVLKKIIFSNRNALISNKRSLYGEFKGDHERIYRWQLLRFNKVWERIQVSSRFYAWWAKEHNLPKTIQSLSELNEFPILTKKILQENSTKIFYGGEKHQTISTGGSTGEPTKFITSKAEKDVEYANTYLGRGRFGIKPFDKTLLIWGHSHLFGTGMVGQFNQVKRQVFDKIINVRRLNAYDLSERNIALYANDFRTFRPEVIIGYTSSIYYLSQYMLQQKYYEEDFSKQLKGIIVTSETVTQNDVQAIKKAFQAPVVIEYGMAETGVIAYTNPIDNKLHVFWDSFIARAGVGNNLIISTLYPRKFPLINYDTTDVVDVEKDEEGSILYISNILGREKDNVTLRKNGGGTTYVSGILLVHLLKGFEGIFAVHYLQKNVGEVTVLVQTAPKIELGVVEKFLRKELVRERPDVDSSAVSIMPLNTPLRTVAGKLKGRIEASDF